MPTPARSARRARPGAPPAPSNGGQRSARGSSSGPSPAERAARGPGSRPSILDLLDLLGHRWAMRILWELSSGPTRFTEIQDRCDAMSPSVLNQRLAELGRAGLVQVRPERRYGLTPDGSELVGFLAPLDPWSRRRARRSGRSRA